MNLNVFIRFNIENEDLRTALQRIRDHSALRSEFYTNDEDVAAAMDDIARLALAAGAAVRADETSDEKSADTPVT
jgi:hypothetical protein